MATNKRNGSKEWTIGQLVDRFYTSRFNRDNLFDPKPGEDIENSIKHRLYNKSDVKELMKVFAEFFIWAINAENIGKIYLSKEVVLVRESKLPRLKKANNIDAQYLGDKVEPGKYYITDGRYAWLLWLTGDTFKKMQELRALDPEFIAAKEQLLPEMEERNKNANKKD